jgi:hypothetical protein
MPTAFTISITKQIIEYSKYCGTNNDAHTVGNNCAVATALIDIFPKVFVTGHRIYPFGMDAKNGQSLSIPLPLIAQQFIQLFDGFCLTPKVRLLLPEFEFTIDIPDEIIEKIDIDEVKAYIDGSKHMRSSSSDTVLPLPKPALV